MAEIEGVISKEEEVEIIMSTKAAAAAAAESVEEKCGLDMSSYQDLPKSSDLCNGASAAETNNHNNHNTTTTTSIDPDNSYVFVSDSDGDLIVDDASASSVGNKHNVIVAAVEEEAEAGVLRVLPQSDEAAQLPLLPKLDNVDAPPQIVTELEDVVVDAENYTGMDGVQGEKTEIVAEAEIKQLDDPNKKVETSAENEIDMVGDHSEKIEAVAKPEEEKVEEDLLESEPYPGPVEHEESQVEALELLLESGENEVVNNMPSLTDKSGDSKDECEGQINIKATDASVVDATECGSKDTNVEGEIEVELSREIVESLEVEGPLATSLDSAQESYPISNKEETLEEEAKKPLDLDEQVKEDLSVSHTDTGVEYPEETHNHTDVSGVSGETMEFETKSEAPVPSEISPASEALDTRSIIGVSNAENVEEALSSPVDSPKSLILQNGLTAVTSCTTNEASLGSETVLDTTLCTEKEPTIRSGEVNADIEVSSGNVEVVKSPPATFDVILKPEADVDHSSALSSGETTSDVVVECRAGVPDTGDANNEGETQNAVNLGDQKELTSQIEVSSREVEVVESIHTTSIEKLEPEAEVNIASVIRSEDTSSNMTVVHRPGVLDNVDVNEGDPKDVENLVDRKEPTSQTEDSSEAAEVARSVPATCDDVKLEPRSDVSNVSDISKDMASDVTVGCKTEVLASLDSNNEVETKDVEELGDQLDGAVGSSNRDLLLQENVATANIVDGREEKSIKTKTKPFNFLIRVPRFDDESLREQIRLAKLHVDEKTKLRDAIQGQIQEIRANSQIHGVDYEYARGESRNARKLVRSKRMEIDALQSVINKAKNALSVEDINSKIYNMEHMIQHETLPLKEEKQLIREIKQLKQLREQLSSNMGSQDEIKQALEQRVESEERLKIVRKELDILKNSVLKAEAAASQAEKKYDDENKKVKELQAQFRAANDVRQAAYVEWQNLRKELSMKNTHFFRYKDDCAAAGNSAFNRDTNALYRLCTNHVECFMELWNTNEEFRKDYVKYNARSTVRRLGTLDGRAPGPDEEPPVLPSYFNERVNRMVSKPARADPVFQIPAPEQKQEKTVKSLEASDDKSMKKVAENKNQTLTNNGSANVVESSASGTVSLPEVKEEVQEEPKMSKEEIELIKKAEEKRKEEAEAKLKEERRLEGLAKAKEARERKKRQAEKLQMRAELKTQKEAELREKEREKRLRKKERKRAGATDVNDAAHNNVEAGSSSETSIEITKDVEVKEAPTVVTKKPQKPWLFTKQSKTKSVPPPLRNRNKKKLQQWMWVLFTCSVILVLFWLGNIGAFSNVNLKRQSG